MKKKSIIILSLLLTLVLAGCEGRGALNVPDDKNDVKNNIEENIEEDNIDNNVDDKQDSETEIKSKITFKELQSTFGFADESAKRIITLQPVEDNKLENPEDFNIGVGNNGDIIRIRFVKWQDKNEKDSLRQTMYNFGNMAGYIYEVESGKAISNEVYLLSKDSVIDENKLIKLESTLDTDSDTEYYKDVDDAAVARIEAMKNRKVIKSNLLSQTDDGAKICLFLFERQGDDMLFSLAYINDDKVVLKDYPAIYDEYSTWRVDAGDEPGLLKVLFLAESDEGLLLGMTWGAPEGESVFVLKEEGGVFQDTELKNGRYWSPL